MLNEYYEQGFGGRVKFWTGDMEVEAAALEQLRRVSFRLFLLDTSPLCRTCISAQGRL